MEISKLNEAGTWQREDEVKCSIVPRSQAGRSCDLLMSQARDSLGSCLWHTWESLGAAVLVRLLSLVIPLWLRRLGF